MTVIRKATQSAIWLFADSWLSLIWGVVYIAIMARLLGPEVYGVMALGGAALGIGAIILGDTLTEGLKQFEDLDAEHSNIAFWLNLGLGALYTLIIFVIAEPLGDLFGSELVGEILPVLALISLLGSIGDVPEALLERHLEHKKLVILENLTDIPVGLIAILLAIFGFGIWALIIPSAITTLIWSVALFWISKWRPGFTVSRRHWDQLIGFARDTLFTKCLGYLDSALPTLALGYFVGERALGMYSIAMNFAGQLSGMLMGPFSEIAMTVVARLQTKLDQVRGLLDDVFQLTTFVMYPAILGACLVVPLMAPMFLGAQWSGIEVALILALLLGLRDATGEFNIAILRGLGDTKSPLISLSVGVVILVAALPFAAGYGLVGVVALVAFRVFATWPLSAWFVQRVSGYPAMSQFTTGWRCLLSALGMAAIVFTYLYTGLTPNWPDLVNLVAAVGLGIISYIAIYGLLWPQRLRTGFAKLKDTILYEPEPEGADTDLNLAAS